MCPPPLTRVLTSGTGSIEDNRSARVSGPGRLVCGFPLSGLGSTVFCYIGVIVCYIFRRPPAPNLYQAIYPQTRWKCGHRRLWALLTLPAPLPFSRFPFAPPPSLACLNKNGIPSARRRCMERENRRMPSIFRYFLRRKAPLQTQGRPPTPPSLTSNLGPVGESLSREFRKRTGSAPRVRRPARKLLHGEHSMDLLCTWTVA